MWPMFSGDPRKNDERIPVTSREMAELCFAEILMEAGILDSQLPERLVKSLGTTTRPVTLIQKETLRGLVTERDQLQAENIKLRRYAERLRKLLLSTTSRRKKLHHDRPVRRKLFGFFT